MPSKSTTLCNYIRRHEIVEFVYDGDLRVVEPHLLGTNFNGTLILSAWQRSGPTPQGWRDFNLRKIRGLQAAGPRFRRVRPGYNRKDTTIVNIICRISTGGRNE